MLFRSLIPLYERDFEENKTNSKWLKRAVSRMFNKECTDDPLFEKLAIAYAEASPSADAYSFVAGVLAKKGDVSGAQEMRMKAFDLETDPLKKANFKLKFAQAAKKRGQKSKARQLAREAIALNPNMGRAYLFIASLYASSVNACGTNEFEWISFIDTFCKDNFFRREISLIISCKLSSNRTYTRIYSTCSNSFFMCCNIGHSFFKFICTTSIHRGCI